LKQDVIYEKEIDMASEVVFPLLGLSTGKGRIIEWLRSEGDKVEKREIIAKIETEKVETDLESPASGILRKILIPENVEVETLTVIAVITQEGEELPEKYVTETSTVEATTVISPSMEGKDSGNLKTRLSGANIIAAPIVRKLAKEHDVDLSLISGSGPGGRITKEDVMNASKQGMPTMTQPIEEKDRLEVRTEPLSLMRNTIARRMVESFETPHFYLTVEIDAQRLREVREDLLQLINDKIGINVTITDIIIMASARAVEDNPLINCNYDNGKVKYFNQVNIGLVTAVEGGLLVPVIFDASKKSIMEIVKTRDDLVRKARERRLTSQEMRNSTFTISNLGMFGIDWFSAILQPPEAAILAVGRITERAVARNGQIIARPTLILTLTIDHRVLDGKIGAEYLQSLKDYLENPVSML
jgi:pyruvate dehydrogenase E2 component (dihydrolipoamide acetyltransferase)